MFDLFGTLTDPLANSSRPRHLVELAACIGASPHKLARALVDSLPHRLTNPASTRDVLTEIINRDLGLPVQPSTLDRAVRMRLEHARSLHTLRPDAVFVLGRLRDRRNRIAVVSDCSSETAELWDEMPLAPCVDARVLSCEMGRRKPSPGLYRRACDLLEVPPQECWYVGDGGSRELTGAQRVGMRPVLLADPDDDGRFRLEPERDWHGPRVDRLDQLLHLVVDGSA